jgi:hypothetical protein
LLVLLPLAGCADNSDLASTAVDLARAERIWQDPWVAPDELAVPTSAYGSDGHVVRLAGTRETAYAAGPRAAAARETGAALTHGWALYAATCRRGEVTVQVVRGTGTDDAALASLVATRPPGRRWSTVQVVAVVPHHADGSWPVRDARVRPGTTCLGGGTAGQDPVSVPREPTGGDGEAAPEDVGWSRASLTDDESALIDELAADPLVDRDPGELLRPDLREGDHRRFGVHVTGEVAPDRAGRDPRGAVAAVVAGMTAWEPTWALCTPGPAGSVDVRLRRVTEHGVATARLRHDPSTGGRVAWVVRLPVPEGPVPSAVADAPALADARCLGDGPLPAGITIEGQPVSVPSRLQPVAR